jgi:transposase-like protein
MPQPRRFTPPHCPNPRCRFHLDSTGWRFKRAGFYDRLTRPFRVQRYRCATCRRAFSSQTFSVTYWLRRPELLEAVFHAEVGGSGHRQIARQHGVAHSTIQRLVARLGRHCLLVHETFRKRATARLASEPVVMDGLGSFAGSQYSPLEITGLVGARSYYSHDFVVTEQRRRGTMTEQQKRRRTLREKRFGRPDPGALRKDVLELLRATLPKARPIELRTDEKREYVTALRRLSEPQIEHSTTNSKEPRTPRNPLFAVNAHHMFLRHSGANHKRETIAFSKRIQGVIYRHAIFQVWQNLVKPAAERDPTTAPAQRLGVTDRRWTVAELLAVRRFPTRRSMRRRVVEYYWGLKRSRFVRGERTFEAVFAV